MSLVDIGGSSSELMQVTVNDLRVGNFPIPTQSVGWVDRESMRGGLKAPEGRQFFGLVGQEILAYFV